MNTRRFYKLTLFACIAFLVMVIVFQRHDIGFLRGNSDFERIPLTVMKGTKLLVLEASIDGRAICMALDTAASKTCFDINLIEELQLETIDNSDTVFRISERVDIQTAHVKSFKIGDFTYQGDFCFMDLTQPNIGITSAGGTPTEGLLGAEFLVYWNAVIDYKDLTLVISKP
jgi:hypothetical protein